MKDMQMSTSDRGLLYIEEFDAYCFFNGKWKEPICTDPSCIYCANRPETAKEYIKAID